jgi:hypothetical protein
VTREPTPLRTASKTSLNSSIVDGSRDRLFALYLHHLPMWYPHIELAATVASAGNSGTIEAGTDEIWRYGACAG